MVFVNEDFARKGEYKAFRIGKRLIGPPSRGDRSRFLWEKNSDAALAGGSGCLLGKRLIGPPSGDGQSHFSLGEKLRHAHS
jgi:hypothetical protein